MKIPYLTAKKLKSGKTAYYINLPAHVIPEGTKFKRSYALGTDYLPACQTAMKLYKELRQTKDVGNITINPDSVITTAPADYTVTINGAAVPILDRWGYPITTDRLCTRKKYVGRYIESETPHITLMNVLSNEATAASTGGA